MLSRASTLSHHIQGISVLGDNFCLSISLGKSSHGPLPNKYQEFSAPTADGQEEVGLVVRRRIAKGLRIEGLRCVLFDDRAMLCVLL